MKGWDGGEARPAAGYEGDGFAHPNVIPALRSDRTVEGDSDTEGGEAGGRSREKADDKHLSVMAICYLLGLIN